MPNLPSEKEPREDFRGLSVAFHCHPAEGGGVGAHSLPSLSMLVTWGQATQIIFEMSPTPDRDTV